MKDYETWKDIPGYEGLYQVSDLGRVRSLDRNVNYKDGRQRLHEGRILRDAPNSDGRLSVSLAKDKKSKTYLVHALVAVTFIGERPEGFNVCHRDGDFLNNNLDNLRYDTQSENRIDIYRYGSKQTNGKLSIEQVLEIRQLYVTGNYFQYELAKMFGVYQSSIERIVNYKTFKWLNDDGTIKESKTKVS